jgi:hypothetical protein
MIAVMILGFYARARAKHRKQKGRFFASLAILMTIGCLVWSGTIWGDYHRGFSYWSALERRASLGEADALDTYQDKLEDKDFSTRREARWSLLRVQGDHAVPMQARLMNDPDVNIQWEAARVLERSGPVALPYLIEGLQHPNAQVQRQCAQALDRRLPIDIDVDAILRGEGRAAEIRKIRDWWGDADSGAHY